MKKSVCYVEQWDNNQKTQTHITLTKEEVVGGTKQKDEQKKQTILKFILSPKYF